ncbi:glycosyltransferase family 2 protein [Luteimicrobium sp. NPDC057192]|uniref:glycosyltransferase family 2 protein n=1 Tax=Luteimicrobium sp. NPDC057192 TaxID=3346042 RepID=UPI003645BE1F
MTVLLCAKNAQDTVGLALRSTLRAMPRDAELRVLDDGSSDGTYAVMASVQDPRVVLGSVPRSLGWTAARQRLLDESDSAFVAIMDADDVTFPWRFWAQRRELGDADLLFSPIVSFGRRARDLRPSLPVPISVAAAPLHLMLGSLLSHPTMYARREALVEVGGYRDGSIAEDYDLQLRVLAAGGRIRRGAVPVLGYRVGSGQVSSGGEFLGRAGAAGMVSESHRAMMRREFGWASSAEPNPCDLWQIIDREAISRRLGRAQRALIHRYARMVLGSRQPGCEPGPPGPRTTSDHGR